MTSPALREALEALESFADFALLIPAHAGDDELAHDVTDVSPRVMSFRRAAKAYEALSRANSSDVSGAGEPTEEIRRHRDSLIADLAHYRTCMLNIAYASVWYSARKLRNYAKDCLLEEPSENPLRIPASER